MNISWVTMVCWWLWFCGCHVPSLSVSTVMSRRRPADSRVDRTGPSRGFPISQQKGTMTGSQDAQAVADQEGSDTVLNFGLGFGLETPLIDSLLDRLIRRKQLLLAAAAAGYPSTVGWGGAGVGIGAPGFYSNPAAVYPYAGGGAGVPWGARPPAYPYPFVPPVNPYGGGWGAGGGVGGWGVGGFNPLFDFDNDFTWRNQNQQQATRTR